MEKSSSQREPPKKLTSNLACEEDGGGGQIKKSWEKVGGQIKAFTITRTNKNDIKKKNNGTKWRGGEMSPFSIDEHAK